MWRLRQAVLASFAWSEVQCGLRLALDGWILPKVLESSTHSPVPSTTDSNGRRRHGNGQAARRVFGGAGAHETAARRQNGVSAVTRTNDLCSSTLRSSAPLCCRSFVLQPLTLILSFRRRFRAGPC